MNRYQLRQRINDRFSSSLSYLAEMEVQQELPPDMAALLAKIDLETARDDGISTE